MSPRTFCIDFDGVLHSYTSGWQGAEEIPDPPTPGAQMFVEELLAAGWEVIVCSTRAETRAGAQAIQDWWAANGFPGGDVVVAHGKPPALVYLDDRGLRFEGPGAWPTKAEIEAACVPWNKR